MRIIALVAAVFACLVLGSPAPASAQQSCSTFTVFGNYVMSLGGIDVSGQQVTRLLFLQIQSANAQGIGAYVGVMHSNVHGGERTTVNIAGTYQIFVNCIVHILIPDAGFQNTITGAVVDAEGAEIVLASVFDPGSQLTGFMRRRFF
jgi:hypothetical protein